MNTQKLKDRIALITGASRGIGRAAALEMARQGAHVILIARTEGGLTDVDDEIRELGGTATLVPLDVRDYEGIDRLGAAVFERWGKLDILVGNAGLLGNLSPLGHILPDDWQMLMDVNLTANWRLIRSFDVLLRQSDAGRAIFVTSGVTKSCNAYWGGYTITKAGLDAMVKTYAAELATTNVRANLLSPGPVRTHLRAKAYPGEDVSKLASPEDIAPLFVKMAAADFTRNGETVCFER
ncbi:MAG TPA: SDR family NAD(P)-dependent oxidoreductase [Rhizobiales bacterium]|nr:SDR family NAD(P)-dependent oxidoreductase [Hyphomicrobiales bacterium]